MERAESWTDARAEITGRPDDVRFCAWPRCGRPFRPNRAHEEHCCETCRQAFKSWKTARSRPLMDPLLDWSANRSERDANDRQLAGAALQFVARRVREARDELAAMASGREDVAAIVRTFADDPDRDRLAAHALRLIGLDRLAVAMALGLTPPQALKLLDRACPQWARATAATHVAARIRTEARAA